VSRGQNVSVNDRQAQSSIQNLKSFASAGRPAGQGYINLIQSFLRGVVNVPSKVLHNLPALVFSSSGRKLHDCT
jgi:hypothetical protein